MTTPTAAPGTITIRLSHPWRHHRTRDILELPGPLAQSLIRGGVAVDVDTIITAQGSGYFEVQLSTGSKRVRGRPAAIKALEADALP